MTRFSRKTVLAATDLIEHFGHARITRFLLEHGLENEAPNGSKRDRANGVARYLIANPDLLNDEGQNLTDAVVGALLADAVDQCTVYDQLFRRQFSHERFCKEFAQLDRALARDGFTVERGLLRRSLPEALDLPKADDEVHVLLAETRLDVPLGHLNQGIAAHARGDWAAANAQFRAAVESLFDGIAVRLAERLGLEAPPAGNESRIWLSRSHPPFFLPELNEWTGRGTGFFEGLFRRLHPQGAHPGLSGEVDSTFRLHLVLLTSRTLLRRLVERLR
jgi:hypothetical protein